MKILVYIIAFLMAFSGLAQKNDHKISGKYQRELAKIWRWSLDRTKHTFQPGRTVSLLLRKNHKCIYEPGIPGVLYGKWEIKSDTIITCVYNKRKNSHHFLKIKLDSLKILTYRIVDKCLYPLTPGISVCKK